jgi:hypothetical protein
VSYRSEIAAPPGEGTPAASGTDATYPRVGDLPLRIERCELLPLARDTSSGFTKVSIVVRLTGNGHEGQGEDITWDQIDQIEQLRRAGDLSWLRGRRTLDEFSTLVGLADLFPVEPIRDSARFYRRWAFESAALDLAVSPPASPPWKHCAYSIPVCISSSMPPRAGVTTFSQSWHRSPASMWST